MRYAIYFAAPADDPLMKLGTSWLGRDPFSSNAIAQPDVPGMDGSRFAELTADPRKYGFHGTLKAPFTLKTGSQEGELLESCEVFASTVAPFSINGLSVNRLGKFLALTPDTEEPELAAFAGLCVRHFEPMRAPLSEADLKRRRQANLTPKQDTYVEKWGYPYIFDEFRFHMTLSNKLDNGEEAAQLEAAAKHYFASVTGTQRRCTTFGLYTEAERGAPFKAHTIFNLTGGALPSSAAARFEEAP